MNPQDLNSFANILLKTFEKNAIPQNSTSGIRVNPVVSEIAHWYEKLRNAMEYREEEVLLRSTIERILKRRLILGGSGQSVATPLIRELVWARYFPDGSIQEETIAKVSHAIDLHLKLRELILSKHDVKEIEVNQWMFDLLSSGIEQILHPNEEHETMINFMFHILKKGITITDDTEETRDVQVYIAVRRAFAKNDIALLRYHLFLQFFGKLTPENIEKISDNFKDGRKEIERQLTYPLKFKIFSLVKKQTPPFLILDDVLSFNKERSRALIHDTEKFKEAVIKACQKRYDGIRSKVRVAIIRSVIFILISKAIFAFGVEGTIESILYKRIEWRAIFINIAIPPILMIIVGLFIKTPDKKNTERIYHRIQTVLFDPNPILSQPSKLKVSAQKKASVLDTVFTILWFMAFFLSFGFIIYILTLLRFSFISQAVFVFFLAIVTFIAYRIYRTAHIYTVEDKQNFITPLIDFLFLPVAQVGKNLTEGISQVNIFLFLFDYMIETPFKGVFGFFEQLFFYLHTKRDYLE